MRRQAMSGTQRTITRKLSTLQRTVQLANHTTYGCSWIPTLTPGEQICRVCGIRSVCPDCWQGVTLPRLALVYCSDHRRIEA